jgi:DNA-directed RNA polymerase subunit RPC12/RpoP
MEIKPGESILYLCNNCNKRYEVRYDPDSDDEEEESEDGDEGYVDISFCPFCSSDQIMEV